MRASSSKIALTVFIAAYILIFGTLTAFRHANFQTQAWDMGIFEQTFWNTIHGRVMQNTIEEIPNHLGIHMSPFLFLLVPGFALFPSPYYLLVIQTIALALGAIPTYLLALRILKSERLALFGAGAYLLYPALHWVNWFDFHEIAFFVPLSLAGIYFLEARRWGLAWLFFIPAASTKEDAILMVAAIGLWLLIKKLPEGSPLGNLSTGYPPKGLPFGFLGRFFAASERKHGAALLVIMLVYFFIATKLIMPALGGGLVRLDRYGDLGTSIPDIAKNLLLHPTVGLSVLFTAEKLTYFFWLFLPLALLPLFAWKSFIFLALPGILENTLTSYAPQFSGIYQYDAVLIGGLLAGTLYAVRDITHRWPRTMPWIFYGLAITIVVGFLVRSPIRPSLFPVSFFRSNPHVQTFRSIAKAIPDAATIAAPTTLVPHIANRERIFTLGTEPYWVDQKLFQPDIVIVDGADLFGFYKPESLQKYADLYAESGLYAITIVKERYFIFTRKNFSQ